MRDRSYALLRIVPILVLAVMTTPAGAKGDDASSGLAQTRSRLGSYLAARLASNQHDAPAAAAFYGKALQQDPANAVLLDYAFQMEASQGNWPRVEELARELVKVQPTHRLAQTFLGIAAFKAGRYAEAEERLKELGGGHPVADLTNVLARAWIIQAQDKSEEALGSLDAQKLPDWASTLVRYHRALLADVAGRTADARISYGRISKSDQRMFRITLAFASHAAHAGDVKLAQGILNAHFERSKGDGHPYARALLEQIEAGRRPQLLVTSASEGIAELFYGLGDLLLSLYKQERLERQDPARQRVNFDLGIIFVNFALYLTPDSTFPLLALADAQESVKRHAAAIAAYDRLPKGTPIEVLVDISKALNLNQLERVDEAQNLLDELSRQHPRDLRPLEALGNIMRAHKRYAEAAEYYSRAIALIAKPEAKHWTFFYARGTCHERLKKLPEAEADLQRSLQLSPDQHLALNYLGYTWIDHGRNLRKGLAMIEKAVRLKPDDGYIVDSLGWAHYRLGNFQEAVKYLEQAVALMPQDATLNDHLGDAYWRVSREREARFQWDQALKLDPEPAEADKIRQKLEKGLPASQPRQAKRAKEARRQERPKRRSEVSADPPLK